MSRQSRQAPSVAAMLAPILARVPVSDQPLVLALAERLSAQRYRAWARLAGDAADEALLLGCAERGETVAARIESLRPQAGQVQQRLAAENPELTRGDRELFEGRPLPEQYALQLQAQRAGAATWKAVAGATRHAAVRELFLACARLEEDNAQVLELLLQRARGGA